MHKLSIALGALCFLVNTAVAQISYDDSFWSDFENEEPFVHPWNDIPDVIDVKEVGWWFNLTRHFMLGIERGVYMNDTLEISPDCFGELQVKRINEFAAMAEHESASSHLVLQISIIYQLYYMLTEKCHIDYIINDMFLYCWNVGCHSDEIWERTENNVLYMTRALIDAGIVWYEGVPEEKYQNRQQWDNLSRQTGETVAEVIKEFTGFEAQNGYMREEFRD